MFKVTMIIILVFVYSCVIIICGVDAQRKYIMQHCKSISSFIIDDNVYECKLKNSETNKN